MKVAVITAIYDGFDTLKPTLNQFNVDVEWICVTDGAPLPDAEAAEGYTLICDPRVGVHPARAAKRPKMLPWEYTDADASIWIDASYRVVSPYFVLDVMTYASPIAQFKHPWRDCIYDEVAECIAIKKYAKDGLELQGEQYRAEGHPDHWGLWASGVIARHHTPTINALGWRWLADVHQFSWRDQISQPPALRELGLRPVELPGTHLANKWLKYEGSGRHG